jgi:hypothetical protein
MKRSYVEYSPKYILSPPWERIEVRGTKPWITLTRTFSPAYRQAGIKGEGIPLSF